MSPVETLLVGVLGEHERVSTSCTLDGWAHRCVCGEVISSEEVRLSVPLSPRVSESHRAHVAAEQAKALQQALAAMRTHNGTPVTPENLRWAATHEALCRSWIFDALTGVADLIGGTP